MTSALMFTPLVVMSAQAPMGGMHATKAEAEQRAAELKCKDTHAMGTMGMACAMGERS
jgi:hypothetical protein